MGHTGGALSGLRVLDTATLYAAPYVATMLADHGADVVKVEPPGGDPYRTQPALWPLVARGKRSVVIDMRTDEGCDAIRVLVPQIDVIVVNMPTATLVKRGLDFESLIALNPELVMAHISGFGLDGPYSDRVGNGTLAEAYAGLTYMTGEPDGPPVLPSTPLGDAVTALAGAFGVLAACYHRIAHGGGGQLVDINPVDALLHVIGPVITEYAGMGDPPIRLGSRLATATLRNVFPTADGEWVAMSLSTPRQVSDVMALVGHDDVDTAGKPVGDFEGAVRRWTLARPRVEVMEVFVAARLPATPVNSARDLHEDPHLQARGAFVPIETAGSGPVFNPVAAPRLLGSPAPVRTRTPDLDEHGDEIYPPR